MKITQEHYRIMAHAINTYLDNKPNIELNLSQDWLIKKPFTICINAGLNEFICKTLYKYCEDSHIQTAYKKIISERYKNREGVK